VCRPGQSRAGGGEKGGRTAILEKRYPNDKCKRRGKKSDIRF